jgi:hypothetical protein
LAASCISLGFQGEYGKVGQSLYLSGDRILNYGVVTVASADLSLVRVYYWFISIYNLHAVKALPTVFMIYKRSTVAVRLCADFWRLTLKLCFQYRRFYFDHPRPLLP